MAFDAATWVFATLLAMAGVAKLADPAATGSVLRLAKLPGDHALVRVLGAAELVLGAAVLVIGGRLAALLLAAAYVTFALFAERQRRHGGGCGCFGEHATPASRVHVFVDAAGAATAIGSAFVGGMPLASVALTGPNGLVAVALVALGAASLRLVLVSLPDLFAARSLHTSNPGTSG